MDAIRAWLAAFRIIGRYLLYRRGLCAPPSVDGYFVEIQHLVGQFVGWNRYIRVVHPEKCPADHPAVFYGNHVKLDDPFYIFRATWLATGGRVGLRAMLRAEFFKGRRIFDNWLLDMNEFMACLGTYTIDRDHPTLAQLKTFVGLLEKGESFIMFPGRTRTASGLLMDYRGPFQEPGGISFFLHQMQRKHPGAKVSAVPCYRNYNPRTRHTCCVFGDEQFLEPGASREVQRVFDTRLVEAMAPLVAVNAVQLAAVYLFLYTVHGGARPFPVATLIHAATACGNEAPHPYWDEEDTADWSAAVRGALELFAEADCVGVADGMVAVEAANILRMPDLDKKFRKCNPVRFYANQILHLTPVVEHLESAVLRNIDPKGTHP